MFFTVRTAQRAMLAPTMPPTIEPNGPANDPIPAARLVKRLAPTNMPIVEPAPCATISAIEIFLSASLRLPERSALAPSSPPRNDEVSAPNVGRNAATGPPKPGGRKRVMASAASEANAQAGRCLNERPPPPA
mgnify:CR=1 FL=1